MKKTNLLFLLIFSSSMLLSELQNIDRKKIYSLFKERDFEGVINTVDSLSMEDDLRTLVLLSLLRLHRYTEVIELLKGEEKTLPQELMYFYSLYNNPQYGEEALVLVDSIIKKLPYMEDVLLSFRLNIELSLKMDRRARFTLRRLLDNYPTSRFTRESILNLSSFLFQEGNLYEVRSILRKYIYLLKGSERPPAVWLLAEAEGKLGRKETADSIYREILQRYPQSAYSPKVIDRIKGMEREKGVALYKNGKFREALKYLRKSGPFNYYLVTLFKLGYYEEFLKLLSQNKSLLDKKDLTQLYFYAGLAEERMDKPREAMEFFIIGTLEEGDFKERCIFELTNILIKNIGGNDADRDYIYVTQRLKDLEDNYLYFRFGLVAYLLGRGKEAEELLGKAVSDSGFVGAQALFWLYKITGDARYRETIQKRYPISYYTLRISPSVYIRTERTHPFSMDSLDRIKVLLLWGEYRSAYREVKDSKRIVEYARFASEVGDDYSAVRFTFKFLKNNDYLWGRNIRGEWAGLLYPTPYLTLIKKLTRPFGLEPELFLALVREESWFERKAHSSKGALGLAQLMPFTAKKESKRRGLIYRGKASLFIPEVNLTLGVGYISYLLDEFGDYVPALAAYNAGPKKVREWLKEFKDLDGDIFIECIPYRETRNFVRRVLRSYYIYRAIFKVQAE